MQPELPLPAAVAPLFAKPRHAGRPGSGRFRYGTAGAVKSGSLIELWIETQSGRIMQARFEAFGGPATIACGEWLCRWLIGRDDAAARQLSGLELAEALGLPAAKRAVALLAEDALRAALAATEYDANNGAEVNNDGT